MIGNCQVENHGCINMVSWLKFGRLLEPVLNNVIAIKKFQDKNKIFIKELKLHSETFWILEAITWFDMNIWVPFKLIIVIIIEK